MHRKRASENNGKNAYKNIKIKNIVKMHRKRASENAIPPIQNRNNRKLR